MNICPACGSSVEGQLCFGCPSCGARAVGPPLAKPDHQLLSYGPAVITATSGVLMLAAFLTSVVIAWIASNGELFSVGAIVRAAEIAAWQSKWIALPVAIAALWIGLRLTRSIRKSPKRFAGLAMARAGFSGAIVTTLVVGTLIGVTVPERLRRRQWSLDAAEHARGYTLHRALLEYRDLHGTLPQQGELLKELRTLPDPNGSIAEALRFADANGYQPGAVLAAAGSKNKALPREATLQKISMATPSDPPAVSFTNYDWRLPGADKLPNTDDDVIMRDGLIMTVSEFQDYRTVRTNAP